MNSLPNQKQSPAVGVHAKSVGQTNAKSFIVPSVVPRDCPDGKDSTNARRESNTSARAGIGMPLRPPHVRRPSATKFDADMLSVPSESEPYRKTSVDTAVDLTFHDRLVADDNAKDTSAEKHLDIKSVAQKFDKVLSPKTPSSKKNCEFLFLFLNAYSLHVILSICCLILLYASHSSFPFLSNYSHCYSSPLLFIRCRTLCLYSTIAPCSSFCFTKGYKHTPINLIRPVCYT